MKQRKVFKKLVLNKETISNLGKKEIHAVKGGFKVTCKTDCTLTDPLCSNPLVCATYDPECETMMMCTL